MEEEDRNKMIKNCEKLVKEINWHKIWPKLLEHGIYGPGDKNIEQWKDDLDNVNNNRNIYLKIMKRGPDAFKKFVQCLREIGRNDLAVILKPENSADQVDNNLDDDNPPEINGNNNSEMNNETIENESDEYYKELQRANEPLRIVVKKATKFTTKWSDGLPCYTMKSNPRGLVLIINNTKFGGIENERKAAEHDENNLKNLFEQMGFLVQTSTNLTKQEMLDRMETFSKEPKLRRVDSIFVIIMSHGNEHVTDYRSQTIVCGKDNKFITDMQIFELFTTKACPDLYRKPKVFIFQTCRGEKVQQAINPSLASMGKADADISVVPIPQSHSQATPRNYADVIVAHSTLTGHKAYRDMETGSWYIQILCEVLMNHAHNKELFRMFQMADQRLASLKTSNNECQTSTVETIGFNKQCYLNPGYFGDGTDT